MEKMSLIKRTIKAGICILCTVLIWQLIASAINNALVFPPLFEVLETMLDQLQSPSFVVAVFLSLMRSLIAMLVSVLGALVFAFIAHYFKRMQPFFHTVSQIMQMIPSIAYLILFLFWTNREWTIFFVIFFLVFPISYNAFIQRLEQISQKYHPLLLFYPNSWPEQVRQVFLPKLMPVILLNIEQGFFLGLKSCIMAEILVSVSAGIGFQLQANRLALNMSGMMGWVIWIVLLSLALQRLMKFIFGKILRERGYD